MSTKEEILAAASKRFKTKDFEIASGVKVTFREISRKERRELNARMFNTDEHGEPIVYDKDDQPIKGTGEGWFKTKEGVDITREWLLATMTPVEAVEGLLSDTIPDSLKKELLDTARSLNGLGLATIAGN